MNKKSLVSVFVACALILAGVWYYRAHIPEGPVITSQGSEAPLSAASTTSLNISALSAVSVWVSSDGSGEKVLFEKNPGDERLIASLTKLMTAEIVLENYNLSDNVTISARAATEGGYFKTGETFPVRALLSTMLIGQDNIAAYALAEKIGMNKFVALMNRKANDIGLFHTSYANSVGFGLTNHSTADDLVKLAQWILANDRAIFAISTAPEFNAYNSSGTLRYKVKNADLLLTDPSIGWANRIAGSKTANNSSAGECLLLILKSFNDKGYLINIILKSKDRFGDMKSLVNWVRASYIWSD